MTGKDQPWRCLSVHLTQTLLEEVVLTGVDSEVMFCAHEEEVNRTIGEVVPTGQWDTREGVWWVWLLTMPRQERGVAWGTVSHEVHHTPPQSQCHHSTTYRGSQSAYVESEDHVRLTLS